ncbi:heavy metal-associated isoprenylated plant protein 32-like, partial [Cucurbita pepo subsp. pepo]|uniref:heavy metal-associated isoprenylated plant protein 32-like n=1 Tax=Cucurbita pepo subsp. pepo TaxID=3664 RepID=UPI000C9D7425
FDGVCVFFSLGVFTTEIDAEQGKVTVTGNVDAAVLIKKLAKSGKHAEIWGGQPANNNKNQQNNIANQMKNMQIDNAKGGNNKGQNQKGAAANGGNNQPKGGGQGQGLPPVQVQLQQLQQMKGFQDLKLPPQFKGLKLPVKDQNVNLPKGGKFNLHEGDDLSDEDEDEYDDEDDYDDEDELDDDLGNLHLPPASKMKPMMGNGQIPKIMMNGNLPPVVNGPAGGGNAKKGGGAVPVQGNNNGKNGNGGGGKGNGGGGGGGGSNQKQGGGGGSNQKQGGG